MLQARFLLAALIVAGAALAACSGNFGAGTTQPGQVIPSGPLNPASPTPTPNSASGIVTYGQSEALQNLPQVAGYGGAIAFSVPSPKPSGFDSVPVGVTVAVVAPTDAPDLNAQVTKGHRASRRERPARPLMYIILLATRDVTLGTFPRLAIDVPRDIVTQYHEDEFGIAFYNSADKAKTYRLGVAAVESTATAPAASAAPAASGAVSASPTGSAPGGTSSPSPGATTSPTPSAAPSVSPGPSGVPGRVAPPPTATPTVAPTLPPQRITFGVAPGPLKLTANKPAVFALYALPVNASPGPGASVSPAAASPLPSLSAAVFGTAAPLGDASAAAPSPVAPRSPTAPSAPAAPAASASAR
jgi:hypothetical protein